VSTDFSDLMGDPNGKPKAYGLMLRAPCKSSFEFEMLVRSREAMTTARAEFGRDHDDVEFIEDEPDAPAIESAEPMDKAQQELRDNEDAILSALATLWVTRIAIARATGNLKDYTAACAAEGIKPF
jgi:hypothetical protein